ncbi:NfeD family protein, partial [Rhodoferax sp.]|uniref:NfeD family protein n=1 Tax=Rhodoferax sp. TaxID=50421 RepID=UPI0019FD7795
LTQIDGRKVRVAGGELQLQTHGLRTEAQPPDWRHRLLGAITNPSFALILLMVGVYGLMFEFSSPGFGVPGTVGAICLLLALFALQLLPVNYAALALILLGFALLAAELVTPAFGVLGVGGVVAFVAGGLLLFDRDVPGLGVPLPLIFGLALTAAAAVLLGGGMALRARRAPVVSGAEQLVGARGEVTQVADGQAWARIHGEHWQVRATAPLQPGQRVRVVGMTDLILQVQPEGERHDV